MVDRLNKKTTSISRRRLLQATSVALGASMLPSVPVMAATPQVALPVPPLLETRRGQPLYLSMQRTHWEFIAGARVAAWGFNGRYLGPTVRVRDGDDVKMVYSNRLSEAVAITVSGLQVPGMLVGNGARMMSPGVDWSPIIPIRQQAATCWYHAITPNKIAPHIYNGLAGMWIIEDAITRGLNIPNQYGINDFPVILQDKHFDAFGQPEYAGNNESGFLGDTLLTNGAIGPYVEVGRGWVRLRLLNASNSRRYTLSLSDNRPFHLIANDGGLLPAPISLPLLNLAPGERREVLIDMSKGEEVSISAGLSAGVVDRIRSFFEPSSILNSSLVLTIKPTGLMALATDKLPASLKPVDVLDGSIARSREFVLGDDVPGINGAIWDPLRIDTQALQGTWERWTINAAKPQPFHLQGASFFVSAVNGATPPQEENGWKDTVWVDGKVELLVKFNQSSSPHFPFMYYSQNLEMADRGNIGQLLVEERL
ncbi:cell division protein FtsP [Pragia fontium]|uniref:cell division protein FtsP n=1 Tax=Pragia fontium TaxID=82985 RepID=UPI00064A2EF3|nr:cell division protein FtsP [Pragia fontium]AKJ43148.1 cell division protein FtsI [Pragia fontium]